MKESKTKRILSLYDALMEGRPVNRLAWAAAHGICERSVRRDIDEIQQYLGDKNEEGAQKTYLVYSRKEGTHQALELEQHDFSFPEFEKTAEAILSSPSFSREEALSLVSRLAFSVLAEEDRQRGETWAASHGQKKTDKGDG